MTRKEEKVVVGYKLHPCDDIGDGGEYWWCYFLPKRDNNTEEED